MAKLTEKFPIRMDPPTLQALDDICAQTHRTRANMVRYLILRAKATGLPEVVTSEELNDRMQQAAVQGLMDGGDAA
jgi:predicted DNA-binding protein